MANGYRITIRTNEETADTFRQLADELNLSLGDALDELILVWNEFQRDHEVLLSMTRNLAADYSGANI